MKVLFNPKVVQVSSNYATSGLDYAGYQNSDSSWHLEKFNCFNGGTNWKCTWYNNAPVTPEFNINTIQYTYNSILSNPYAQAILQCGVKSGSDNTAICNNLQGKGTSDNQAGAFAIRHVSFPAGFHSQLYPDEQLLDFIVSFSTSTNSGNSFTEVTAQLINSYTISNLYLSNLKMSYVNYYGHTTKTNKGIRIPNMLRIGGSLLASEHQGATHLHVFFDSFIDSKAFYSYPSQSEAFDLGCSAGYCRYYPQTSCSSAEHTWLLQRRFEIGGLPNLENEFNILIPVQNTVNKYPYNLVIAISTQTRTSLGVSGYHNIINVFRYKGSGPTISGNIFTPITVFNSMADNSQTSLLEDFSTTWQENDSTTFNYKIDANQIGAGVTKPTLVQSFNTLMLGYTQGSGGYGAGITLTSVYFNLFQGSTIYFVNAPSQVGVCSSFTYQYNDATLAAGLTWRNQQKLHTVFCPLDSLVDLGSSNSDLQILAPSFPDLFLQNYPLQSILSYGISNNKGMFQAYKFYTDLISASATPKACVSQQLLSTLYSNSVGKQRVLISFSIPQKIPFDPNYLVGFQTIKVILTLSSDITGLTWTTADCSILNLSPSNLTCSYTKSAAVLTFTLLSVVQFDLAYNYNITMFTHVTAAVLSPTSGVTYSISVQLPTLDGANVRIYGYDYAASSTVLAICSGGIVNINTNPSGSVLHINALSTERIELGARGVVGFSLQSGSFREIFFDTSTFEIVLGFLGTPNLDYITSNGFRCLIYEDSNVLSWKWSTFTIAATSILVPKTYFSSPNNVTLNFKCYGGGTPTATGSDITASWKDNALVIQSQFLPITYASQSYNSGSTSFATTPTVSKKFDSQSFEAFYTFTIQVPSALDFNARVYIEFSKGLAPNLNSLSYLECYLRTSVSTSTYNPAFCQCIEEKQVVVWVNQALTNNQVFYIDIFRVAQPVSGAIVSGTQKIWIGVDLDSDLSNGLFKQAEINELVPSAVAPTLLVLNSVSLSNNLIRRFHTLTMSITMPASTITSAGKLFFIDFPACYAPNMQINTDFSCTLYRSDDTAVPQTNLISTVSHNCTLISLTRLKVILVADATNSAIKTYFLSVYQVPAPSYIPVDYNNTLLYQCFISDLSTVTSYCGDYNQSPLQFQSDTTKQDLQWNFYSISQDLATLEVQKQLITQPNDKNVFIGYYKQFISLVPVNTTTFQTAFTLSFDSVISNSFFKSVTDISVLQSQSEFTFQLGALQTASTGIYTLKLNKIGDSMNVYADAPPIYMVVRGDKCQVNANDQNYQIPVKGSTLPIIFNFYQCVPINDITLNPVLSGGSSSSVEFDPQITIKTITPNTLNQRLIFVLNDLPSSTITSGQTFTLTFTITGTNAASFSVPNPIQINYVDSDTGTYSFQPVASDIVNIVQSQNLVSLDIQCDQPVIIYWAYGIDPIISTLTLKDIYSTIKVSGLKTFYAQTNDKYWRVYGSESASLLFPVTMKLVGLKSNSQYTFTYYCVNQLQIASDPKKASFMIPDNGASLLKIILSFSDLITYGQLTDIACAMSGSFSLNYQRIFTQLGNYYGQSISISDVASTDLYYTDFMQYSFYVQPDFSTGVDFAAITIRELLSESNYNVTLISLTKDPLLMPPLLDIESQNVDTSLDPSQVTVLNYTAGNFVINLKLTPSTNSGYLYIGIQSGNYSNYTVSSALFSLGYSEDSVKTQKFSIKFVEQDKSYDYIFPGLLEDTTYTIFYMTSNDDSTSLKLLGEVQQIAVKTLGTVITVTVDAMIQYFQTITLCLMIILLII